jgi:hypothetical protein
MRALVFACPEDIEGLGMTMGRTRSPSEPALNIRGSQHAVLKRHFTLPFSEHYG